MKKTFGYDSMDGAHCMYGLTKMLTVMNKWVLPGASCHGMSQGAKESTSDYKQSFMVVSWVQDGVHLDTCQ